MFKKPRRNFRSRRQDSGSDDENKSDQSPTHDTFSKNATASTKAASAKSNEKSGELKKVASASSVLSFVNDEDGRFSSVFLLS
jgi:hypothetical protein